MNKGRYNCAYTISNQLVIDNAWILSVTLCKATQQNSHGHMSTQYSTLWTNSAIGLLRVNSILTLRWRKSWWMSSKCRSPIHVFHLLFGPGVHLNQKNRLRRHVVVGKQEAVHWKWFCATFAAIWSPVQKLPVSRYSLFSFDESLQLINRGVGMGGDSEPLLAV